MAALSSDCRRHFRIPHKYCMWSLSIPIVNPVYASFCLPSGVLILWFLLGWYIFSMLGSMIYGMQQYWWSDVFSTGKKAFLASLYTYCIEYCSTWCLNMWQYIGIAWNSVVFARELASGVGSIIFANNDITRHVSMLFATKFKWDDSRK
jgi:hypothetical protein